MKLVEVSWTDAFELSGWIDTKELEKNLAKRNNKGVTCKSVGYIFQENDDILVLVQTDQPDDDDPDMSNIMVIPKSMINKVVYLIAA